MLGFLDSLKNTLLTKKDVVLFGAGTGGINAFSWMLKEGCEVNVTCFCDNNPRKWGTKVCDKPVINADTLQAEHFDAFVVITCGEGDDIERQLENLGFAESDIITPDLGSVNPEISDFSYIWNHIDGLNSVFQLLSDDISKLCFVNILNYKMSHDMQLIDEIACPAEEQYFDPELIRFSDEDIFFNCGAYTGDTIEEYIRRNNGAYKAIYACEADESNLRVAENAVRINDWHDVIIVPKGVYSFSGNLHFNAVGSGSGYIDAEGTESIDVDTIDNILNGKRVTFINMDIEGSEYDALLGARCTIEKYRPTLMISVYHKQNDFIRIPMLIKSLNDDYILYFRHYRKRSANETVCYAISR